MKARFYFVQISIGATIAFLVLGHVNALATEYEKTPEGQMIYRLGGYLLAHDIIVSLKQSECGYLIKKQYVSTATLLDKEVMPAIPATIQKEIEREKRKILGEVRKLSDDQLRDMQDKSTKHGLSREASCGMMIGGAASTLATTKQSWVKSVNDLKDLRQETVTKSVGTAAESGRNGSSQQKITQQRNSTSGQTKPNRIATSRVLPNHSGPTVASLRKEWGDVANAYTDEEIFQYVADELKSVEATKEYLGYLPPLTSEQERDRSNLIGDWKCKYSLSKRGAIWRLRGDGKVLWLTGDDKPIDSWPKEWLLTTDGTIMFHSRRESANTVTTQSVEYSYKDLGKLSFDLINKDNFVIGSCRRCIPFECD